MSNDKHTTSIQYREISRFLGYRFGSDGSFWSCWNKVASKSLDRRGCTYAMTDRWNRIEGAKDKDSYRRVFPKDARLGRKVGYRRCRLILEAFVGPCPDGMEARHLDNNRENDHVDNLVWSTHVDNIADKKRHGTSQTGSKHPMAKLTEAQVIEIRERLAAGAKGPELARIYGVHKGTIINAAYGNNWTEVPGSLPVSRPLVRRAGTKLNASQVAEIRRLRQGGMEYRDIAKIFGVCSSNIGAVCLRKTWTDI